jgi:hypothetical protein
VKHLVVINRNHYVELFQIPEDYTTAQIAHAMRRIKKLGTVDRVEFFGADRPLAHLMETVRTQEKLANAVKVQKALRQMVEQNEALRQRAEGPDRLVEAARQRQEAQGWPALDT